MRDQDLTTEQFDAGRYFETLDEVKDALALGVIVFYSNQNYRVINSDAITAKFNPKHFSAPYQMFCNSRNVDCTRSAELDQPGHVCPNHTATDRTTATAMLAHPTFLDSYKGAEDYDFIVTNVRRLAAGEAAMYAFRFGEIVEDFLENFYGK